MRFTGSGQVDSISSILLGWVWERLLNSTSMYNHR